jgi:hypothetical protein
LRLHESAEREARQRHRQAWILRLHVGQHHGHVVGFASAAVMHAGRRADAAEVEARGHVAEPDEGARERLRDLVVHRAAVQRMWMGDERDAARRAVGRVEQAFHAAGAAFEREFVGELVEHVVQILRRSTTLPPIRWVSMMSSMSLVST